MPVYNASNGKIDRFRNIGELQPSPSSSSGHKSKIWMDFLKTTPCTLKRLAPDLNTVYKKIVSAWHQTTRQPIFELRARIRNPSERFQVHVPINDNAPLILFC